MSDPTSVLEDSLSRVRGYLRQPLLTLFRPAVFSVFATLLFLGFSHEWSAQVQFMLLRFIELLVLIMYVWQHFKHSPSFLEAVGILLIGAGFLFLVSKSAIISSVAIFVMAITWLLLTWAAKHWPLLRGLTTLAVFICLLKAAAGLLHLPTVHALLSLGLFCLLVVIAFTSTRTWHEQPLTLAASQAPSARLWSLILLVAVLGQITLTGMLHHDAGSLTALLVVTVSWKSRHWLSRNPNLRWISPALMIMPVNQVALGIYMTLIGKSIWLTRLHICNGYAVLILSLLITSSVWAGSKKTRL
jgi:hypothetical protein